MSASRWLNDVLNQKMQQTSKVDSGESGQEARAVRGPDRGYYKQRGHGDGDGVAGHQELFMKH